MWTASSYDWRTSDRRVHDLLARIQSWISQDHPSPDQLAAWLQGYDLPAFNDDEDPYRWLLQAVRQIKEPVSSPAPPSDLERKVARQAASLLSGQLDGRPGVVWPEMTRYNLLWLCVGLGCPDELADPLYDLFVRQTVGGEWRGHDLRRALREALIENQLDRRLESDWRTLVETEHHPYLPGGALDGYEGIIRMPTARDRRDEPALDTIGWALKILGDRLEAESNCDERFFALIQRARQAWPQYDRWDRDIIERAGRSGWSRWQQRCLPPHPHPIGPPSIALVPYYYVQDDAFPGLIRSGRDLGLEEFVEVSATQEAAASLALIEDEVRKALKMSGVASTQGRYGVAHHILKQLVMVPAAAEPSHVLGDDTRQGIEKVASQQLFALLVVRHPHGEECE